MSPAAFVLGVFAAQLASADTLLVRAQRHAAAGEITAAIEAYERARHLGPWGINVDLWFSRWMMEVAQTTAAPLDRQRAWQAATAAGERATGQAAERQAACYNLALIYGLQNDAQRAESALRRAIEVAPAWYKPYWMLAQLLGETGRSDEALRDAERGYELNGGKNSEVTETWDHLRRSKEIKAR
jgi:tetratricopeptide (TPR) repeat protein